MFFGKSKIFQHKVRKTWGLLGKSGQTWDLPGSSKIDQNISRAVGHHGCHKATEVPQLRSGVKTTSPKANPRTVYYRARIEDLEGFRIELKN